ncbi:lipopolysaccharide biosynthesis protein [Pedobacter sp. MW01-1-1]|uniref:lipopolysaccharide biosynthesis protein n=1 Tax=Pedobacter sp. MW01-1-1 TaxID=3383027 RepID=UPI003FF13485
MGSQLPKIIGLFLLPFITPYLSNTDFGIWGTVMAYNMLFSVGRDLGLVVPMLNSFYKSPTRWRWVWNQLYFFLLVFGLGFTILQIGVLLAIMPDEVTYSNTVKILFCIGVQSLLMDIPISFGTRFFQIAEKPFVVSTVAFTSGLVMVGVQFVSVVYYNQGYMSWFYATFFSSLVSAIIYGILIHKNKIYPIISLRSRYLIPRLKISLPLIPHNYSSYLLNVSDRVVMNWYKVSTTDIGLYNVAYMWGNYMDLVGSAVGTAVGPMYYKYFASSAPDNKNALKKFNSFLQVAFISGAFILAIWTKQLFYIFIKNAELQKSYMIAVIIIMGYCYRPMYWLVINRLQFAEKTSQLWKISIIGGVINVMLNIVFVPIYGYKVAAFTTFLSLMYIGFSGFFLKQFKDIDNENYNPFIWLFIILLSTSIAWVIQDFSYYLKIVVTIISLIPGIIYAKRII